MLPFEPLQKNLKQLKQNMETVLRDVLAANGKKIIELNTQEQLFEKGIDSKGKVIVPEYAESTKKRKQRKGQPIDRVTLKDTGKFYKGTAVDFGFKDFTIINFDSKYKKLREKYGDDLMGLTDPSLIELQNTIKLQLLNKIKRLI